MRPALDPEGIKKILVIRLDHLGDLAMTRPALAQLRQRFPKAVIDFLMPEDMVPLFGHEKGLRRVIGVRHHGFRRGQANTFTREGFRETREIARQIRSEDYDLGIDFRGDLRHIFLLFAGRVKHRFGYGATGGGFMLTHEEKYSRKDHQVEVNCRLLNRLGISGSPESQALAVSPEVEHKFWKDNPDVSRRRPGIVVHPGAGYPSKQWPAGRYRELLELILSKKAGQVILIGTEAEKKDMPFDDAPGLVDLRGKTRMEELPVLFSFCDVFIGNDSGPAHLGAAQGLEVISIFSGTNNPRIWHPWTKKLHLISYSVPCSPCEAKVCPLGHHDCLQKITVEEVWDKLESVLSGLRTAKK